MTGNDPHDTPQDDLDQLVLRELRQLGPLVRRKAWADANPPDEAFAQELERRLMREDESKASTETPDHTTQGKGDVNIPL